jgi:hypothetical protein
MPSRGHDRKRIEALLLRRERRGLTYAEVAVASHYRCPAELAGCRERVEPGSMDDGSVRRGRR